MHILDMSAEDFQKMPYSKPPTWKMFDSLVIVPTGEIHDSGWACMDFVTVAKGGEPICKFGGGSDIVHINGIDGSGEYKIQNWPPQAIKPIRWRLDMLPCGYVRLFSRDGSLYFTDVIIVSNFEIYAGDRDRV